MKIKLTLTPAELSAVKASIHFVKTKVNTVKNAFSALASKLGKTSHAKEFG